MKAVLLVDQGIADFYRSLIPKSIPILPQRWPAHVSIVRRQHPKNMEYWRKHENEQIEFEYSPIVTWDETYYWLNVKCLRLEEIRVELGLDRHPPWRNLYHITVGNVKNVL